jgi:hypothetical protein
MPSIYALVGFANGLLWKNVDGERIKMTLFSRNGVTRGHHADPPVDAIEEIN